jgi:hypothetical protein
MHEACAWLAHHRAPMRTRACASIRIRPTMHKACAWAGMPVPTIRKACPPITTRPHTRLCFDSYHWGRILGASRHPQSTPHPCRQSTPHPCRQSTPHPCRQSTAPARLQRVAPNPCLSPSGRHAQTAGRTQQTPARGPPHAHRGPSRQWPFLFPHSHFLFPHSHSRHGPHFPSCAFSVLRLLQHPARNQLPASVTQHL